MGGIGQLAGGASNVGQMATDNLRAAEGFNELFGKKG
jgi:hypothetical protein